MNTTTPTAAACTVGTYRQQGAEIELNTWHALVVNAEHRKCCRLIKTAAGFQAENLAGDYATNCHPTEAEALNALFNSGRFAYFGNVCPLVL